MVRGIFGLGYVVRAVAKYFLSGLLKRFFLPPKSLAVGVRKARLASVAHVAAHLYPCCSRENVVMRNFDISPLYRSTVGFDRLFDLLDNTARPDWPPYDIEKKTENEYRISMAIAGFGSDDIELTQHGTTLLVTGQKKAQDEGRQVLHQGIAFRNFKQTFNLADHVKVAAAHLENGLLSIDLVREVPEQLKPRRIEITAGSGTSNVQDLRARQIDQEPARQGKAA